MIDIALNFDSELGEFDLVLTGSDFGLGAGAFSGEPEFTSGADRPVRASVAQVMRPCDILSDDGLFTAVVISLFTDARAAGDDPLPEARPGRISDQRGWWGDFLPDEASPLSIGSRLWLLTREKDLDEVVARAQEYAQEALKWLLDDGHVTELVVTASRAAPGWLVIGVSALEALGTDERTREWNFFYDYKNALPGAHRS